MPARFALSPFAFARSVLARFSRERRAAIALTFALTLFPLVAIIALAIDFSFFVEARSQVQLAADAAATHAVRSATGEYALETGEGIAAATAKTDAVGVGQIAGANWFAVQLGQLPTAYVPATFGGQADPTVTVTATTNPAGFSSAVNYNGLYPPFFNHLFGRSANWNIGGTSGATASYSYVEILMMLDTSQSMLIGANPSDIATMSQDAICTSNTQLASTAGDNAMYYGSNLGTRGEEYLGPNDTTPYSTPPGLVYQYQPPSLDPDGIGDQISFAPGAIPHYTLPTAQGALETQGTCAAGYQQIFAPTLPAQNPGGVGAPCAFACHNSALTNAAGYSEDLYGLARSEGVTLRIDSVFSAAEQVLQSMIANEQAPNQFSAGLYQFNNDVSALTSSSQGANNSEATYNLSTVLSSLYGIDYKHAAETTFPLVESYDTGNTDFPTSMSDFLNGSATGGTKLTAGGTGTTQAAPAKDLFIVTDGMNDTCSVGTLTCPFPLVGTGQRAQGEMTSYKAELAAAGGVPIVGQTGVTAVCQPFKNLNYNIYVLYVTYDPVPHLTYYIPGYQNGNGTLGTNYNTAYDFPGVGSSGWSEQAMNAPTRVANGSTTYNPVFDGSATDSPDVVALKACAGPAANNLASTQTYFYSATNSADIATAMAAMLTSALSSTLTVTH